MNQSVSIETFPNTIDAQIAENLLEANGICATVSADDAGDMLFPMINGVRLMVMEEQADAAREILRSFGGRKDQMARNSPANNGGRRRRPSLRISAWARTRCSGRAMAVPGKYRQSITAVLSPFARERRQSFLGRTTFAVPAAIARPATCR